MLLVVQKVTRRKKGKKPLCFDFPKRFKLLIVFAFFNCYFAIEISKKWIFLNISTDHFQAGNTRLHNIVALDNIPWPLILDLDQRQENQSPSGCWNIARIYSCFLAHYQHFPEILLKPVPNFGNYIVNWQTGCCITSSSLGWGS